MIMWFASRAEVYKSEKTGFKFQEVEVKNLLNSISSEMLPVLVRINRRKSLYKDGSPLPRYLDGKGFLRRHCKISSNWDRTEHFISSGTDGQRC